MVIDSVASLLALLRQLQLIPQENLDEIERDPETFADPRAVAKHLVRAGALTTFQVNYLFQGRGKELVVNHYRLLDPLGQGGVSQVFKAWDARRKCMAAVKVVRPDLLTNSDAVTRFQREIRAVMRLSHPNIVRPFDFNMVGDNLYLAMEYVEGTDLDKLVQLSGLLHVKKACEYIRQAAQGLQHAHERGLVHRDIKPANLLLNPKTGVVKILDLGLARLLQTPGLEAAKTITVEGIMIGTPDYLAPEQARDPRSVDIRADIYSLGCTFYYFLAGKPPFPGGSLLQKLMQHRQESPVEMGQWRDDVLPEVANILQKMMAKQPEDRYQIPLEVAAALKPFC